MIPIFRVVGPEAVRSRIAPPFIVHTLEWRKLHHDSRKNNQAFKYMEELRRYEGGERQQEGVVG